MIDEISTRELYEKSWLSEIDNRIDRIIILAMWITSIEGESHPQDIYTQTRLQELVGEPLFNFLFENVDSETKNLYYSGIDSSWRCSILISDGGTKFFCDNCLEHDTCDRYSMDDDKSNKVNNFGVEREEDTESGGHCEDSEDSCRSPGCYRHTSPTVAKNLPRFFYDRVGKIMKRLFKYLELLFLDDSSFDDEVEKFLAVSGNLEELSFQDKSICIASQAEKNHGSTNARKSCVVLFKTDRESPEIIETCLSFVSTLGKDSDLLQSSRSLGYICVKYCDETDKCDVLCRKINGVIRNKFPESCMFCRVIKVYKLFFMELSFTLCRFISQISRKKYELLELMSSIVNNTSLLYQLLLTESPWIGLKNHIAGYIVLPSSYSANGKLYMAKFYLRNFYKLHSALLKENDIKDYLNDIMLQLIASKRIMLYLIENDILFKMVEFVSLTFKRVGFDVLASVSDVLEKIGEKGIDHLYDLLETMHRLLLCSTQKFDITTQLHRVLFNTDSRLVRLCMAIEDMEPFMKGYCHPEEEAAADKVNDFFAHLHNILMPFTSWCTNYNEVANHVLKMFVGIFEILIERWTLDLSPVEAIEKLLTIHNIETTKFSIFNLTQRMFIDILMRSVMNKSLSPALKTRIFRDKGMLICVTRAAIISLSFEFNYKIGRWMKNTPYFDNIILAYRHINSAHYLFMQDFSALQLVISCLDSDRALKYLILNFFPTIRGKADLFHSLTSILSLSDFDDEVGLHGLIALIYNALTERHFIGKLEDYTLYLMERQLIHILAFEDRSYVDLRSRLYMDRLAFDFAYSSSNILDFGKLLSKIACLRKSQKSDDIYSLVDGYLNFANPFYFLNNYAESREFFAKLCAAYENKKCKFELPEIVELRDEFTGLNDFIFSHAFSALMMDTFFKWYKKAMKNANNPPDLPMPVLMCLCLILKVSKNPDINWQYRKELHYLFGRQTELKRRSIFEVIIAQRPKIRNPIINSIVDYFIELSEIKS
ncbi:hypothetical protein RF11_07291 [Thelohanellus kitauei]|uniref:Uncharacterized protein n=1 Tax=Thelohanellus kitauei TaxID=669202 RepID=A0A0C2IWH9_THEKT|nr:hypothetical protein RF11_07291 [Thelohanellus kitauei]